MVTRAKARSIRKFSGHCIGIGTEWSLRSWVESEGSEAGQGRER
jgi:hypothetical protein